MRNRSRQATHGSWGPTVDNLAEPYSRFRDPVRYVAGTWPAYAALVDGRLVAIVPDRSYLGNGAQPIEFVFEPIMVPVP